LPELPERSNLRYRLLRVYSTNGIATYNIVHLLLGFIIPPRSNSFVDG